MTGKRMTSDASDALNLYKKHKISSQDQPLDYIFSSAASNSFVGSRAMLSFGVNRANQEEVGDDYLDEYFNQPEKKRRLSFEQVQFLEEKFEIDNKLEPDRKIQLAKELGLQPRQIAVWFQNRRARWKTKTLETDYETLHADYESLRTSYDSLLKENEKLKIEVLHLKHNGLANEIDLDSFNKKEVLCESMPKESSADMNSEDEESKEVSKNDEHSDLTDADSPHLVHTIHSSLLDDSSQLFEPNLSDLSLPAYKMGDAAYLLQPATSCYYTFPLEDQPFNFWSY